MSSPTNPWDARFAGEEFFYGTAPNDFLAQQVDRLQGPVLSLAEGEGRNAVFLAERGLRVLGVDKSAVGLAKAERLATRRGTQIRTLQADLAAYVPETGHYGAVISIFAHLPGTVRRQLYPRVEAALQPGGLLLMEAYAEAQLPRSTGGPKDLDMLVTEDKLRREFPGLEPLLLQQLEREVREGQGHNGMAVVVQFIGRKR